MPPPNRPYRPELIPISRLLGKDQSSLVLVIGTGISLGATGASHASWLGLLEHGIRHLVETRTYTEEHGTYIRTRLEEAFSPFDLNATLLHADRIEQNLKFPDPAKFAFWLETAFSGLKVQAGMSETLDAL